MSAIGRNEPCPCGSGKKYKRCCMGIDDPGADLARARRLHALDEELVAEILDWANEHAPVSQEEAIANCPVGSGDDTFAWVGLSSLATITPTSEGTLLDQFRASQASALSDDALAWIEALGTASMGLWEVLATTPGRGLTVRDLLTGTERQVLDASMSESVTVGRVLCARLVQYEGLTLATCVHPHALSLVQAQAIVVAAGAGESPLDPDVLRGTGGAPVLRAWHEAGLQAEHGVLPRLTNSEGETLQETTDSLRFELGDRTAVIEALASMRDTESPPHLDGPEVEFVVTRGGSRSVLGSVTVGEHDLSIQTMSEADGDTLLGRVTSALGGLVRHTGRGRLDMQDALASRMGRGTPKLSDVVESSPEIDTLIREAKTEQYATWPDEELPALAGRTPREAVADPEGRQAVIAILRQIDAIEAQYPEGQRYDAGILRRELGLE